MDRRGFIGVLVSVALGCGARRGSRLELTTRSRDSSGIEQEGLSEWLPDETAIVICDMWDQHWCVSASGRVDDMAPRMNEVVSAARELGVKIVHAPSGTIDFYDGTPARERALAAPSVEPPVPITSWCRLEPDSEGRLPIDDSDGGCDDDAPSDESSPWTRQDAAIEIADEDVISDNGAEIWNYFQQQGIRNAALMGVHANMCVLGRSFGIRQLTKLGMNVVLVRDLTDAMYDPRDEPYVSHQRGTELVIEHIERHWCPSVEAIDLTRLAGEATHMTQARANAR